MELNLFIIQEMMRDWELQPDIARNGEEAVIFSLQKKYDLILMDIQMPVMNGVEATTRIRTDQSNPNNHTPIIAISANAFKSDKESYFKAGMNGVLSKPFDADKLFAVISENLDEGKTKHTQVLSAGTPVPVSPQVKINLSYLLQIGKNNRGFVGMMLQSFRDSSNEIIGDMEYSLERKDWSKMAQLVHKLKFSLNVMGAGSLDEEVKWIESNTRNPLPENEHEMQVRIYAFITVIRELDQHAGQLIDSGEWN
jgi:CheY-like chemotaxis protein